MKGGYLPPVQVRDGILMFNELKQQNLQTLKGSCWHFVPQQKDVGLMVLLQRGEYHINILIYFIHTFKKKNY